MDRTMKGEVLTWRSPASFDFMILTRLYLAVVIAGGVNLSLIVVEKKGKGGNYMYNMIVE
jgi:hypothetical protein